MDFLDPKKKRGYNIRLFVGFVLISIAIILATIILALFTAGYSIDSKTGQVIQNGLIFINAQPTSASIYVNGVLSGTTNARLNLNAGNYSILLSEPGYHTWTNTVTLLGGDVEQLNYPFLFPTTPVSTAALGLAGEPSVASTSPDRHWMLVSVPGQLGSFYVVDLTNIKTPITTVTIPSSVLGNEPGVNDLTAVQWSTDNQHLLLKDTYQGGVQYIMLDWATPSASINVSQTFSSTPFTSIRLDNNAYNNLYLYNQTTGSLVLANLSTKSLTNILSGVISFWPYSSNLILYTTLDPKDNSEVDANVWDANGKVYTLRQLPVGTSYELNMASYSGNLYAVIGSSSSSYAYVYENPLNNLSANSSQLPLPDTLLVVDGAPENASFSDSARFIALQSGSQFAIYDLEYDTHYRYDTNLAFQPGQLATWMDGNRLDAVIGNELTIWDFDGTNIIPYVAANQDLLPAFNTAYDAVYTVVPVANSTTGQWQVVRNSLVASKP